MPRMRRHTEAAPDQRRVGAALIPGVSATRWGPVGVAAGAVALGAALLQVALQTATAPVPPDLVAFHAGARALLIGAPLYDLGACAGTFLCQVFKLPPPAAVLLSPIGMLPVEGAGLLWRLATVLAAALAAWCLAAACGWSWRDVRGWAVATVLLTMHPFALELADGQVLVVLLLVISGGLLAAARGRGWVLGAAIALAATVKLWPAALLVAPLLRRRWDAAVGFGAGVAGLVAVGLTVAGAGSAVTWLTGVLPELAARTGWMSNQSIDGWLVRLVRGAPGPGAELYRPAPPLPELTFVWAMLATGVLAVTAWLMLMRPVGPVRGRELVVDVGFWTAAVLLALPVTWSSYLVLLMPALAGGLAVLPERGGPGRGVAVVFAAGFLLVSIDFAGLTRGAIVDHGLAGALLVWLALCGAYWPKRLSLSQVAPAFTTTVMAMVLIAGALTWREATRAAAAPLRANGAPGAGLAYWEEGITLDGVAVPAAATRSGGATVALDWYATARPTRDHAVFVHLRDDGGRTCAQHDGWPAAGRAPTTLWRPGDAVRDEHRIASLAACPPGDVTVVVGLYDQASLVRLPLIDGATERPVGTLRID